MRITNNLRSIPQVLREHKRIVAQTTCAVMAIIAAAIFFKKSQIVKPDSITSPVDANTPESSTCSFWSMPRTQKQDL